MAEFPMSMAPGTVRELAFRRLATSDAVFRGITRFAAYLVLILLGGIILTLVAGSGLALSTFGMGFFTSQSWNPVTEKFGAIAPVYGTVITSALAMLIATPIGLGIGIFLTEMCPMPLRRPIGVAISMASAEVMTVP